jgi:hypothetical protein
MVCIRWQPEGKESNTETTEHAAISIPMVRVQREEKDQGRTGRKTAESQGSKKTKGLTQRQKGSSAEGPEKSRLKKKKPKQVRA